MVELVQLEELQQGAVAQVAHLVLAVQLPVTRVVVVVVGLGSQVALVRPEVVEYWAVTVAYQAVAKVVTTVLVVVVATVVVVVATVTMAITITMAVAVVAVV